jgi:hypothetical protein
LFHAQRDGGQVHDAQAVGEDLGVGQAIVFFRGRVLPRVAVVDAVDGGGFEQGIGAGLRRTQRGARVGGEERISQTCGMDRADMVRALAPARSMAASSTSAFMTVASIPIASAVGRDNPVWEICAPRKTLPPPTTTPSPMPSLDGRLMDAEAPGAAQCFARELHDHPAISRHGHQPRCVVRCA